MRKEARILGLILVLILSTTSCNSADKSHISATSTISQEKVVSSQEPLPSASASKIETDKYVYSDYIATQEMRAIGVVNNGETSRIIAAMQKAKSGKSITVGFIGGSITYGASAKANYSYSSLVTRWWKKKFPNVTVKSVNAGISGTGSIIGVHRAQKDLLYKNPDFIIVDFAVNDTEDEAVQIAYENLIRNLLSSKNSPAVIPLFMCTDGGFNFQAQESKIGFHYKLPMISYKDAVWSDITSKKLLWKDISGDFIHPNEKGHHIAADLIISVLESCYDKIDNVTPNLITLPAPINKEILLDPQYLTSKSLDVKSLGGFEITNNAHWQLRDGWKAIKRNSPLVFNIKARNITLVYNKTIDNKGAFVKVKVNNTVITTLSSKSDATWEQITATPVVNGSKIRSYEISLEWSNGAPKSCSGENFALLGVMISN